MVSSLPSPPASRPTSPSLANGQDRELLSERLEKLLEQYLNVLDDYTRLRDELSKSFANGFLSLAHAQRTANIGSGRRYDRDGYDGRMKALRRTSIQSKDVSISKTMAEPLTLRIENQQDHAPQFKVVRHQSQAIPTAITEASEGKNPSVESIRSTSKPDPAYRDPATWYGILIPQQLRKTQTEFTHAVDTTIPCLTSALSAMRCLEEEIWRVRDVLGISDDYVDNQMEGPTSDEGDVKAVDRLLASAKLK